MNDVAAQGRRPLLGCLLLCLLLVRCCQCGGAAPALALALPLAVAVALYLYLYVWLYIVDDLYDGVASICCHAL